MSDARRHSSALGRVLRAYPTLLRVGLAEAVAYRAEFVVWVLTMTMPLVMLAPMTAAAREGPVGGFDQHGFVIYYLATLIVRQLTGAWVLWDMVREIREGALVLRLLRPMHPLVCYSADGLAAIPLRVLVSLPLTLVFLFVTGGRDLSHDPVVLACFIVSLPGAWLLNFAISALIGTLALVIESSLAVYELWLGLFMLLSGYLVPLSLFPGWLERAARLTPFPYLQAVPVELLMGARDRHQALVGLGTQLGYAALALAALALVWRRAIGRYYAYGG